MPYSRKGVLGTQSKFRGRRLFELYTAKKIGENSYELVFTSTDSALKDQTVKATARREGSFLFTKMAGSKVEVKWTKK